jgi:hypothetical protein
MASQQWLDRYVAEVGRMLPQRSRADVEQEVRSLLQDALGAEAAGGEPTQEQQLAVLQRFGPPREVAMRYGAHQYVIGPLLYPTFMTVLRVVVGVVLVVGLFGLVVSLAQPDVTLNFLDVVSGLVGSVLQAAAWVVLVFALVERLNLREVEKLAEAWDPRSLPPAPTAKESYDRVSVFEVIVTVVFSTLAVIFLNFNIDDQGRFTVQGSDWASRAIFSPEFLRYIPWLSALLIAEMALPVIALIRGRWTVLLRVLGIVFNLFGIALAWAMLSGPSLAAWEVLDPAFRILLVIIIFANVLESAQQAGRLFKSRTAPQPAL